ncbi:MAG TPA: hypothetical protein VGG85_16170 [Terracidiphilus sp.]
MNMEKQDGLRKALESDLRVFQLGRRGMRKKEWLRGIRQASGVGVKEVARRLGKSECEVYRMEKAEKQGRIEVRTLQAGARALGCELMYVLVPREGTLGDLAAEQAELRAKKRESSREARNRARAQRFRDVGGPEALRRALRAVMRGEGIRMRTKPRGPERLRIAMPVELEAAYLVVGREHKAPE